MTHQWVPSSPCGISCVQQAAEAGIVRLVVRILGLTVLLAAYPFAHVLTPAKRRQHVQRRFAHMVLRCCGLRLRVVDLRDGTAAGTRGADTGFPDDRAEKSAPNARYAEPGNGTLVVAGHIGWTDIVALAAVQPLGFVARADLIDWPILGTLARLLRVVPLNRENLRDLPRVVDQVAARLASGERIGVFPEGTTWCGRAYGRLRPAFFQAAIDSAIPVQPVRLRYLDRNGNRSTIPGFVGDDTFTGSALRVLRSRGITAEVTLAPVEQPGSNRRDLALRCERSVRATDLSADAHAVLAAATEHLNHGVVQHR
ncbi:1-acyl-sn-glycerol-3-phosphate acyltransferase [Nocardia donostiensis]|uniref:lysophospholipid acyltransferase family protein n=1 Tax=Nocardia donostiensis TaxID=1538463 RepID=UPI0009D9EC5F|nr:lysophospholipid acyltransferase family protein [Nocardia donostiensis]OQS14786.1 1-acyl-sn-glycerol-3-phosphate acyltransferase [Nocardia donostiensis]